MNGAVIVNNSEIFINAIGEGDDKALLCFTDLHQCCDDTSGHAGEWYFPNKSAVDNESSNSDIYRSRGPSVVHLHRRNSTMMPTGMFRCEIPDASGVIRNIYVGVYSNYERTQTAATSSAFVIVVASVVAVLLLSIAGVVVAIFGIRRC